MRKLKMVNCKCNWKSMVLNSNKSAKKLIKFSMMFNRGSQVQMVNASGAIFKDSPNTTTSSSYIQNVFLKSLGSNKRL